MWSPNRSLARLTLACATLCWPATAEAHTPLQGMGGFWSGVAHLLTSPDEVGFLLGLAISTSFQDRRLDARMVGVVFVAALTGAFVGTYLPLPENGDLEVVVASLMVAVGVLGAVQLRLRSGPLLGLASFGGLVEGAAGAAASSGLSPALFSLGSSVAGASIFSYGVLLTRPLNANWGHIARRVGASWIAAVGLITLAFLCVQRFGRL